ncbi:MAG TPA: cytochrome d ubiquinol oxidase subunit II [Acidimicrobiales bacterium]|nr:cytochrome d ubiquinol oxidase subunit II [Acidimicrobiales bacterium]
MSLHTIWFIIIAFFWCGFFVLEGFDFGVGVLHTVVGRSDIERRIAINTIGPFWDGNEVWLIVAGAATFAAFPSWYATMFSALYLALVLLLVALFGRGVSFEFRGKVSDPKWKATWTWSMAIGSALIPVLIGIALGDLLHGLPINKNHEYTGSFWGLLTPYGIWTGITFLLLSLTSGANFLVLKTRGDLRARSLVASRYASGISVFAVIGFIIWSRVISGGVLPDPVAIFAALAAIGAFVAADQKMPGWAFGASIAAIGASVATIFVDLYSNVMVSSTNSAYNLTVTNASSSSYSLKVMSVVAIITVPLVLFYQGWNYWVFSKRVSAPPQDESEDSLRTLAQSTETPTHAGELQERKT